MTERRQNLGWLIFAVLYFGLLMVGAAAHRNMKSETGLRLGSQYRIFVPPQKNSPRSMPKSLTALRKTAWLDRQAQSLELLASGKSTHSRPATTKLAMPKLALSRPQGKVAGLVASIPSRINRPSSDDLQGTAKPLRPSAPEVVGPMLDTLPHDHGGQLTLPRWQRPEELLARLERLMQHQETARWAAAVRDRVLALVDGRSAVVDEAALLARLADDVDVEALSGRLSDPELAIELRRAGHALGRRVAVWEAARASSRPGGQELAWRQVAVAMKSGPAAPAFDIAAILDDEFATLDCVSQLEGYEQDPSPDAAHKIAERCRLLATSPRAADRDLGHEIDDHYRNCNLRMAMTEELISRLLPQPAPRQEPVRDTILGLPVAGRSTTSARLGVELVPDPAHLRLNLLASGQAASTTAAFSGPVTLWGESDSHFLVRKPLEFDLHGIRSGRAVADARAANRLRNLMTRFDAVPLLGGLMRDYALQQHNRRKAEAEREIEGKVAGRARLEFDATAAKQLAAANRRIDQTVFEPLRKLSLNPSWMLAETTRKRMTVRMRLASDEQLGAHTPRPRAPADSLASLQVHQSAFNNLLERLELGGRTFSAPELYRYVEAKLNRPSGEVPDTVPQDLEMTFAPRDAMRVSCADGRIELRLALAELRFENKSWNDLLVRVHYRPQAAPPSIELVRDGVVHLKGDRLGHRSQIMLRGLFSRMFPRDGGWVILKDELAANPRLRGLAVTQFDVVDGWIGIAVGPAASVRPAYAAAGR